jgi:hypothetical protein
MYLNLPLIVISIVVAFAAPSAAEDVVYETFPNAPESTSRSYTWRCGDMTARVDAHSVANGPRDPGQPEVFAYINGAAVSEARRLDLQAALRQSFADIGPRCLAGRPYVTVYWVEDWEPGVDDPERIRGRSRTLELIER